MSVDSVGITLDGHGSVSLWAKRCDESACLTIETNGTYCEIGMDRMHVEALRDQLPDVLAGLDRWAAEDDGYAKAGATEQRAIDAAARALDLAAAAEDEEPTTWPLLYVKLRLRQVSVQRRRMLPYERSRTRRPRPTMRQRSCSPSRVRLIRRYVVCGTVAGLPTRRKWCPVSLSNPPEAALWLSIPDSCRMRGEFEVGDHALPDVHFLLGNNGDDKHLLFEREALERFVTLAQRMLAVPVCPDSSVPRTLLDSSHGYEIREKPARSTTA